MRLRSSIHCLWLIAMALCSAGCEPGNLATSTGEASGTESCCELPGPAATKATEKPAASPSAPTIIAPPVNKNAVDSPALTLTDAKDRQAVSLDFTLTDQDGKPFVLKSIKGKPTVATFIFTRCPNPNMCPLQGVKMAALQKELDKAGLSDKVNLLLFTFDPDYDTPPRLKAWGETNGIRFTNAKMLRPDPREFTDFRYEFGFRAFVVEGKLDHRTDLMLFDREGKLAAFYGGMWEDAKALADVKTLIAEK